MENYGSRRGDGLEIYAPKMAVFLRRGASRSARSLSRLPLGGKVARPVKAVTDEGAMTAHAPKVAAKSPPHSPQCAHWGTFPPGGRRGGFCCLLPFNRRWRWTIPGFQMIWLRRELPLRGIGYSHSTIPTQKKKRPIWAFPFFAFCSSPPHPSRPAAVPPSPQGEGGATFYLFLFLFTGSPGRRPPPHGGWARCRWSRW